MNRWRTSRGGKPDGEDLDVLGGCPRVWLVRVQVDWLLDVVKNFEIFFSARAVLLLPEEGEFELGAPPWSTSSSRLVERRVSWMNEGDEGEGFLPAVLRSSER